MNFKTELTFLMFIATFFMCNSINAQSNARNEISSQAIASSLVQDKEIKLDAGTKQASVWTLSDYDANPKEHIMKIISAPKNGKAIVAKDGVSIIYTPASEVIHDELSIEVCHISGPCDQATISFVQSANQISRSGSVDQ